MKVKYIKEHNNYNFILEKEYEASKYKDGWLLIEGQLYREEHFENIDSSSIKEIMNNFNNQGVDDLEIKKDNEVITIGYFKENPVDCIKIRDNKITHIIFGRQEKLNWLFNLMDNQIFIECDL